MPTLRSMNHGGISRCETFAFIERAHGRASSYVINDIGAIESGRWHFVQEACRIGATSFVNVTWPAAAVVGRCAETLEGALIAAMTIAIRPTDTDPRERVLRKRLIVLPPLRTYYHVADADDRATSTFIQLM